MKGFNSGAVSRYRQSENNSGHWSDLSIGSGGEVGSLKWFKDQATDREKNEALHHCKVFREGDEVGRTLDLSIFNSYEEIYDRLGDMFSVPTSDFKTRLVYQNAEGSTRHVGAEPYRSFVTAVKRLTILPEASNGSAVRS